MSEIQETEGKENKIQALTSRKQVRNIKSKVNVNYAKMSNMRIIQKQLVYVIGLSSKLAFKDVIIIVNIYK